MFSSNVQTQKQKMLSRLFEVEEYARAAKRIAMNNELHQEMCSKFSKLYKLQTQETSVDLISWFQC